MKRLIILKVDLTQIPDKTPQSKWKEWEQKLSAQAVKDFEKEAKKLTQMTIVKNYLPHAEVLIEMSESEYSAVYEALLHMAVVQTIDSILRKE